MLSVRVVGSYIAGISGQSGVSAEYVAKNGRGNNEYRDGAVSVKEGSELCIDEDKFEELSYG